MLGGPPDFDKNKNLHSTDLIEAVNFRYSWVDG